MASPAAPSAFALETRVVERGTLSIRVMASGTIEPAHVFDVNPEISGRVRKVHADFNERVRKGATLVELDSELLAVAVEQAEAQVALAVANTQQATATRDEAQLNLSRAKTLSERSAGSKADIDATQATLARANAGLAASEAQERIARASLLVAKANLDRATIRSPIDGIVLGVSVTEGQAVAALQPTPLFHLARDLVHMRLIADVPEADVGRVRVGEEVTFTVSSYPDKTFAAKLVQVRNAPRYRENGVTFGTVLEVENKDGLLRPGMIATAEITTPQQLSAILVPNAALKYRPPGVPDDHVPRVYILKAGGPVAVPVTPRASDGTMTAVKDGELEPGALVIIGAKAP